MPTTPDKLAQALADLQRRRVLIGIPAGEPREGGTITNAAIGYINEFGSPAANIPARPHLVPGVQAALPAITKYLQAAARAALTGADPSVVDSYFEQAGQKGVDSVKALIRAKLKPQLAESTVKARRLRRPDIHYRVRMQIVDAVEAAKGTPRGSPARLLLAQLRERYNLGKQVYLRAAQTPEEATPLLDTSNYINSFTAVVVKK